MGKYCVYCGNPLKNTDKFCIICGKPVLRDLPKSGSVKSSKPKETKNPKAAVEEEDDFIEVQRIDDSEDKVPKKTKEDKKKKGKKETVEEDIKPLPFEVKEQMVLYIEYEDLQLNKRILSDKLKELQKSLKNEEYEYNEEFKQSVNMKLDAIKALIAEYKQKEDEIKQKMDDPFIVQRIKDDIDTRVYQLTNLSREHKLHKVDRTSFEQLREKYSQEKAAFEKERDDLIAGIKLWIKELKIEKAEMKAKRNLFKGRFASKEVSKEDFEKKDKDFELKLKKLDVKIKTLEELTK